MLPTPCENRIQNLFCRDRQGTNWRVCCRFSYTEPNQDIRKHELRDVLGIHAVAGHHDDCGAFVNVCEDVANRPINRYVNILHGISCQRPVTLVEPRMSAVVEVPCLVADTMRFGEHMSEEIPILLTKKVFGNRHLAIDAPQESVSELR